MLISSVIPLCGLEQSFTSVVKNASKDMDASALSYTLPTVSAVPRVSDVPLARSHSLIPRRVLADVVRMTDFLVAALAGLAVAATSVMLVLVLDRLGLYQVSKFA